MNQRDLDLLSAYLDGELSPSDSTRLESRFQSEPGLVSVLNDLRSARSLLRRLPRRRAPRNFTLTRKMVGLNPPLPRSYPAFRFATVIATLLFFFTFGFNALAPQFLQPIGIGGGGGVDEAFSSQEAAATEAPAAPEASVLATEAPTEAADLAPQPTMTSKEGESSARAQETLAAKEGGVGFAVDPDQFPAGNDAQNTAPIIPAVWQILFAVIAVAGTLLMTLMRRNSSNRWK